MRTFKLLFLALTACTIMSCGGDDDCTTADFAGTYTGTDCDGAMIQAVIADNEDGTISITLGEPSFSLTYENLTPDGCEVDIFSISFGGFTSSATGELDGNDFVVKATSNDPDAEVCDETVLSK